MILKIVGFAVLAYVVYGVSIFSIQRSIIFPRRHIGTPEINEIPTNNIEKVWLSTSKGKVEAWYIAVKDSAEDKKRPVVIFSHGNAELIDYCVNDLSPYNTLGIDILLVEYPGYGRSEGKPSQRAIIETLTKAYDWLIENKDMDSSSIIAHGRSVGGGAACGLAKERKVRALILQSTFTDAKQFARGFLLPSFLVRDPFDNLSVVRSFEGPVLVIHGKYDEMIPYSNSVRLSNSAKNAKFITYNCHHNDCPPDFYKYWKDIQLFLTENEIIEDKPEE